MSPQRMMSVSDIDGVLLGVDGLLSGIDGVSSGVDGGLPRRAVRGTVS